VIMGDSDDSNDFQPPGVLGLKVSLAQGSDRDISSGRFVRASS